MTARDRELAAARAVWTEMQDITERNLRDTFNGVRGYHRAEFNEEWHDLGMKGNGGYAKMVKERMKQCE